MNWTDIACIVFACVTANHLGLISAIERVVRRKLWIVDCPKCLTCWSVMAYGLSGDGFSAHPSYLTQLLAISFLSAYVAIWLELFEGFIDKLYDYVYNKIYPTADTAADDAQRA